METSKRSRRRKLDTAKTDLKPPLAVLVGQGVHREVGSEGPLTVSFWPSTNQSNDRIHFWHLGGNRMIGFALPFPECFLR
jgi:hypothetical protein